jgi:hypothetical protein
VLLMSSMSVLEELSKHRCFGPSYPTAEIRANLTSSPLMLTAVLEPWWLDVEAGLPQEPSQVYIPALVPNWTLPDACSWFLVNDQDPIHLSF